MALTILVAYDISADPRRSQAAALLQAWGERVQRSVFICLLDPEELDRLCRSLLALIDVSHDILHVIPLCAECRADAMMFGQAHLAEPPLHWFV